VIECSNGVDDDGDGLVDFPDDDGCRGPRDRFEERRPRGAPSRWERSASMWHR
jgi:hypothetical protein